MPYDLYGNSYKTAREAEIAEMAQCAEIDARINSQRIQELERRQQPHPSWHADYHFLCQHIEDLNKRVSELEEKLKDRTTI
jgi:hypothetical protein